MENRAPAELVLVEFPGNKFEGEIIDELGRLVEAGTITVLDALLIRKDADGTAEWFEANEVDDSGLADLVGDAAGFLAEDDVNAVVDELEPNSSVGMMLFEHSWARQLTGAINRANGRLIDSQRVPAAALNEIAKLIDEEV
jgi:hypothetical protein